jgi:hypothetical protein
MLARSFKSAEELGMKEVERDALITVLGMMERGEIEDQKFNMNRYFFVKPLITVSWDNSHPEDCRTPACICGWANHVSGGKAFPELVGGIGPGYRLPDDARVLFNIMHDSTMVVKKVRKATVSQTAIALASYLTTGKANWKQALEA